MSLYAHQQKIIDEDPAKCGLFLGTGTGKTRTALRLARGNILVIAPKTQVEDRNWEREYAEVLKEQSYRGPKNEAKTIRPRLTVMSKEAFRRDAAQLERFDTVIVDEAHTCLGVTPNVRYRNRKPVPKASQLFEALQAYIDRIKPMRFYLCTATIMKSPMTVWGAATLLGREWNWYEFREAFYKRLPMPGREVWVPRSESSVKDRLAEAVKGLGYIGRLEDFFDVPDQNFKTIYVELTKEQRDRINGLKHEYPEPIVRIGKKHQVENGSLKGDEFSKPEHFESEKIAKILDLACEFPRMVIFAKYAAQLMQIHHSLSNAGYRSWVMDGDTEDRGKVIQEANENDGILIVQAQISAGWELPKTPIMVFASRTYSFVDYDQALGRIQRANHIKKNLYINLVVKGGIDEAVDKSLRNKQDFNERLYNGE